MSCLINWLRRLFEKKDDRIDIVTLMREKGIK